MTAATPQPALPPSLDLDRLTPAVLDALSPQELLLLQSIVEQETPIWVPQPGPQEQAFNSTADILLFGGAAGGGKCIKINELCLIWRTGGENVVSCNSLSDEEGVAMIVEADQIRVGDYLPGSDGKPVRVLAKSEIQTKPFYRVDFDDGSSLDVSDDHIWTVYDLSKRAPGDKERGNYRCDMTTEEIMSAGLRYRTQRRFAIPVLTGPVDFPATRDHPRPLLPPYALGYWLGNGHSQGAAMTCHTEDRSAVVSLLERSLGAKVEPKEYDPSAKRCTILTPGWIQRLREFGVETTNRVFNKQEIIHRLDWRTWRAKDRALLLAGLMDSDGHANRRSDYEFDNTCFEMVELVRHLLQSLGEKPARIATKRTRPNEQPIYRTFGTASRQIFRLPRKAERLRPRTVKKCTRRYIDAITPIGTRKGVCFYVDAPDHLYVAGRDFIVTHNTSLAIGLALTVHFHTLFVRREGVNNAAAKEEMAAILGSRDRLNNQSGVFRLDHKYPGQKVHFVGVPNPGDEAKYQGQPRDLLVIDEAANVLEAQARFLMGWVRPPYGMPPHIRPRTLLCSNPPTSPEGAWLISFFAPWLDHNYVSPNRLPKPEYGELRWFTTVAGKDIEVTSDHPLWLEDPNDPDTLRLATDTEIERSLTPGTREAEKVARPKSRSFIKSQIDDNIFLQGTGYKATLQSLPEPLRSQMLRGDFLAGLEDDIMQAIPSSWVQAAMDRWEPASAGNPIPPMSQIGVDPSRGGRDKTVIARRHHTWYDEILSIPGQAVPDGPTLATEVIKHRRNAAKVVVDVIGIGSSPVDFLRDQDIPVTAFTGSETWNTQRVRNSKVKKKGPMDRTKTFYFRNKRAHAIWTMRELLDPQYGVKLALPPDEEMKADLCSFRYRIADGNIIVVESKDEIRKRLKRSPDKGEAVIYATVDVDPRDMLSGVAAHSQFSRKHRPRKPKVIRR